MSQISPYVQIGVTTRHCGTLCLPGVVYDFIAVHTCIERLGWTITHLPTGRAISRTSIDNRELAVIAAKKLAGIAKLKGTTSSQANSIPGLRLDVIIALGPLWLSTGNAE